MNYNANNNYDNRNNFCPYCGNPKLDINDSHCRYCKNAFPLKKLDRKTSNMIILLICFLFFGPFVLFGGVFLGVGLYEYNDEHSKAEGYEKTIGYFVEVDYSDCTYDDDEQLCKAIYEYEVNGIRYDVSTSSYSNYFDDEIEVYYNPNNPSESIIFSPLWTFIVIGGIFFGIGLSFIIILLIIWFFNRKKT